MVQILLTAGKRSNTSDQRARERHSEKDKNCTSRAPLHRLVRHPSKAAVVSRLRMLRPDPTAAPATRPAASAVARRASPSARAKASVAPTPQQGK